LKFSLNTFY